MLRNQRNELLFSFIHHFYILEIEIYDFEKNRSHESERNIRL